MKIRPLKFIGFGTALGKQRVENDFFEHFHNLEKGKIEEILGLRRRYHVQNETMIDLAAEALTKALTNANLNFENLDLVISASVSPFYTLPNNATMIAQHLGKSQVPCMDVNQSCLSWLAALEMASSLLQVGQYRNIAIVSAETPSKILNTNNLETHCLFGDAAAAVIVSQSDNPNQGVVKSLFRTYPEGWNLSLIPAGGLAKHPLHDAPKAEDFTFQMQNHRILLYSLKKMKVFFSEFFTEDCTWNEVDKFVPHQGSRAGLDFFCHEFGIENKVIRNFEQRGNCVAASIPLAFCEAMQHGEIKENQKILLTGTAAGISLGAVMVQF